MHNLSTDRRILSRPVPIHWSGWETDTLKLQRSGWQLAVEFEGYREEYRLIMRHREMNMTAICDRLRIEQGFAMFDYDVRRNGEPHRGVNALPMFQVRHISPSIEICRVQTMGEEWDNFNLIDAKTQMTTHKIDRIEDLNVFAVALDKAEQVVIDKADMQVVDHLAAIKELQSDKQRELRDKARHKREPGDIEVQGEVVVQMIDYRSA